VGVEEPDAARKQRKDVRRLAVERPLDMHQILHNRLLQRGCLHNLQWFTMRGKMPRSKPSPFFWVDKCRLRGKPHNVFTYSGRFEKIYFAHTYRTNTHILVLIFFLLLNIVEQLNRTGELCNQPPVRKQSKRYAAPGLCAEHV